MAETRLVFYWHSIIFFSQFEMDSFFLTFVGDCKPSEVKAFTTDYLEKVVEPCDWLALWCTDGFDVLVEVSLPIKTKTCCSLKEVQQLVPVAEGQQFAVLRRSRAPPNHLSELVHLFLRCKTWTSRT